MKKKEEEENPSAKILTFFFKGGLGDCFMLSVIIGLVKSNKELLSFLIPCDNASKRNMRARAYHFRFWDVGSWYDVVVDDMLPVYPNGIPLLFSRNLCFLNEFWMALFEKAAAK